MARPFKRVLVQSGAFLLALAAASFICDYAVLGYRIAAKKNPYGQVTVTAYFAIPLKDGRVQYEFQPPQSENCVNALYPHRGMQPCWYLSRHREKRIDVLTLLSTARRRTGACSTPGPDALPPM